MWCRDACLVNNKGATLTAIPLYCNSWGCEICQPRRRNRLIHQICEGEPTTFLTLTANPKTGTSPDDRAERMVKAWREVVRRHKKKTGNPDFPYFVVVEATKKGEPHLHIVTRVFWIDQKWLSRQMDELCGAPIVDIRRITNAAKIAGYIAKYLGKMPHKFTGLKRYWRTLKWSLVPKEEKILDASTLSEWYRVSLNLDHLQALWEYSGRKVVRVGNELRSSATGPPRGGLWWKKTD